MQPGPSTSATVNTSPAFMATLGETFQPWPSSREALLPVPSVADPPFPGSPVGFSALIDRVCAGEVRNRLPRFVPSPLNGSSASSALTENKAHTTNAGNLRGILFMDGKFWATASPTAQHSEL